MSAVLGIASAAAQFGLQLLVIKPQRGFFPADGSSLVAQATIEEVHEDDTDITDHPVEQGATISDHAFARPSSVIITCGWSNSPSNSGPLNSLLGAAANSNPVIRTIIGAAEFAGGVLNLLGGGQDAVKQAYQNLLTLRQNRTLITVYTGKRIYKNMLIKNLAQTTDLRTENSMIIRVTCREILMAATQTVTVPDSSVMANPAQNGATQNAGIQSLLPSPTYNVNAAP
jgi:hypothetical protein